MKRRDYIVLAIVLVASLVLFLLRPHASNDSNTDAYLRISLAGQADQYVALNEERDIRIEQENGDYNIIHIYPDGFRVIEANCYNQDCIHQGEVTTANIESRLLLNEIICLPHRLVLSLVTAEEAQQETAP
jgi:hypothetical protein